MPPARTAPTLTDGVVTLRAHREDDAQRCLEQCQDPTSQQWTRVPVPYTLDLARTFLGVVAPAAWAEDTEWLFAIEHEGRFGGSVSLRNEGDGRTEIAYGAHPDLRGTGVVERALRLLLAWGFEERGVQTVLWWANKGNWASRKLAWRLGFTFEGTVRRCLPQRGELLDGWVGSLLRDDPREPRQPWLDCPVIEGEGFRLRPFRADDLDRIVEGSADPDTQFWLAQLPTPYTRADAAAYLEAVTERHATNAGVTWAVADAGDDRLVGTMGLFRLVPEREAEVGYWTHPEARGRGLTRRAAELAVRHAFEALGVQRVTAYASAGNTASRRVIEALGLRQSGIERLAARTGDGTAVDLVGYDLLAEEFASRT